MTTDPVHVFATNMKMRRLALKLTQGGGLGDDGGRAAGNERRELRPEAGQRHAPQRDASGLRSVRTSARTGVLPYVRTPVRTAARTTDLIDTAARALVLLACLDSLNSAPRRCTDALSPPRLSLPSSLIFRPSLPSIPRCCSCSSFR